MSKVVKIPKRAIKTGVDVKEAVSSAIEQSKVEMNNEVTKFQEVSPETTEGEKKGKGKNMSNIEKFDAIVKNMLVYIPESNHKAALTAVSDHLPNASTFKLKKKKSKKSKLPDEPKRANSAYVLYTTDRRPQVVEELKKKYNKDTAPFAEITKTLAEYWRNESEEVKKKYQEKHEQEKRNYTTSMEKFWSEHEDLRPKPKKSASKLVTAAA